MAPQGSKSMPEDDKAILELQAFQASVPGKLEVLLHKVDRIEESQNVVLRKMDGLHAAIYDPDVGLFARIKENAVGAATRDVELDQQSRLTAGRLDELAKTAGANDERNKQIDASLAKVDDLVRWKSTAIRVAKYVFLAVVTSLGGFFAKIVYDWITGHVRLI